MSIKHQFSIPEPCHEDWNKMSPTQKGRFCDSCAKEVKDFSQSKPDEIAKTLLNSSDKVCGRFRKDQLTPKTPKLIDLIPSRPANAAKVAAAALAFFSCDASLAQGEPVQMPRGNIAYTPVPQAEAQSQIRGMVLDEDGRPLPFVNVHFTSTKGALIGAATDEEGLFTLSDISEPIDTPIELIADYIGYQSKVININLKEDQFIEIRMNEAEYFLMGDIISIEEIEALPEPQRDVKPVFDQPEPPVESEVDIEELKMGEAMLQEYPILGRVSVIEIEDDNVEDTLITVGTPDSIEVIEIIENEEFIEGEIEMTEPTEVILGQVISIPEVIECQLEVIEPEELGPTSTAQASENQLMGDTLLIHTPEAAQATEVQELNDTPVQELPEDSAPPKHMDPNEVAIKLYPNPSSHILHIGATGLPLSYYHVVDQSGKVVMEGKARSDSFNLNTSVLSNGRYMIMLFIGEERLYSKQFVISR